MDTVPESARKCRAYAETVVGAFDEEKVKEVAERARLHLGGRATLTFIFVSCELRPQLRDLTELIQIHAHCRRVVGCSAGGLISMGQEDENAIGFSLVSFNMPHTELFISSVPDGEDDDEWLPLKRWNQEGCSGWILLGHPLLVGDEWIGFWNEAVRGTPTYGGLASGSHRAENLFIFDERGEREVAALAIGLRGGVRVEGLVSQGCRPIGDPLTITKAAHNLIHQLASRNAYEQLQEAFQSLPEKSRKQAQGYILVGLAMSEYVDDFHQGDFLVRSILGGDPDQGILAVGAMPRVGQTLQFQLRDRDAADEELRELLERKKAQMPQQPFGGLLFSCGGRGEQLFGVPNHDASLLASVFGPVPLAGFFCNGEIGSIAGRTYLHGYTASGVLLVEEP